MFKKKKPVEQKVEEALDATEIANDIVKKSEMLIKGMEEVLEYDIYCMSITTIEAIRQNVQLENTSKLLLKFENSYEVDQFLFHLRLGYELGHKVDEIHKKLFGRENAEN